MTPLMIIGCVPLFNIYAVLVLTFEGDGSKGKSMKDALKEMTRDPLIYSVFGEHTYNKYLEAKQKEWDSYRSLITPWEIENYLVK